MTKVIRILSFTAALMAIDFVASFAHAGGAGNVGGGNIRSSTASEVISAIFANASIEHLNGRIFPNALRADAAFPVTNKKAREMIVKLSAALAKNGYVPYPIDGPCYHQGAERDSSVKPLLPNTYQICLSVSRLRRFPKSALSEEISVLILHEISHTIGYGEDDAIFIQNYVHDKILNNTCALWMSYGEKSVDSRNYLNEIEISFNDTAFPDSHVKSYFSANLKDRDSTTAASEIDRKISMIDQELKGKWSFEDGGSLEFPTADSDGLQRRQKVEFGPAKRNPNPSYYTSKVKGAQIVIDGKIRNVDEIVFHESCRH